MKIARLFAAVLAVLVLCGCAPDQEPAQTVQTEPAVQTQPATEPAAETLAPATVPETAPASQPAPREPVQAEGRELYEDGDYRIGLCGLEADLESGYIRVSLQLINRSEEAVLCRCTGLETGDYSLFGGEAALSRQLAPGEAAMETVSIDMNVARLMGFARLEQVGALFQFCAPDETGPVLYTPALEIPLGIDIVSDGLIRQDISLVSADKLDVYVAGTALARQGLKLYIACENRVEADICTISMPAFQEGEKPLCMEVGDGEKQIHSVLVPLPENGTLPLRLEPDIFFCYDPAVSSGSVMLTVNASGEIKSVSGEILVREEEPEEEREEIELQPGGFRYVSDVTGESYVVNPDPFQGETAYCVDTDALGIGGWLPIPLRSDVMGSGELVTYFPFENPIADCRGFELQITIGSDSEEDQEWYVVAVSGDVVHVVGYYTYTMGSTTLTAARFQDLMTVEGIAVIPVDPQQAGSASVSMRSDAVFAFDTAEAAKAFLENIDA